MLVYCDVGFALLTINMHHGARQDFGLEHEAPISLLCGQQHVILNGKCANLPAHSVGHLR